MLEAFLSGLYASYELKLKKELATENSFPSAFHAMSFLDQFVFGKTIHDHANNSNKNPDYRLVNVDLSGLVEITQRKGNQRFFWNKFYQEFINKFEIQVRTDFKVFSYGVQSLSFLIDAKDLDYFFGELKEFSNMFLYWKYFETPENILALEIKPKVTMVPMSSFAYIKTVRNEKIPNELLSKVEAQKKTKEIVWGREQIDEI